MHAKCIAVDPRVALITSANFTEAAQGRNIEAGVLVRHKPTVRRLVAYFEGLVERGDLRSTNRRMISINASRHCCSNWKTMASVTAMSPFRRSYQGSVDSSSVGRHSEAGERREVVANSWRNLLKLQPLVAVVAAMISTRAMYASMFNDARTSLVYVATLVASPRSLVAGF